MVKWRQRWLLSSLEKFTDDYNRDYGSGTAEFVQDWNRYYAVGLMRIGSAAFYPEGLPAARITWLTNSERFGIVEVDSTVYRSPTPRMSKASRIG